MYVNPLHQLTDREALFALMASHPLGAWVCHGHEGLIANHVPFLLDRSRGPFGTLIGHVARANTVWRELGPATPSVVMFQGPQAYITPGWYPSKVAARHGRSHLELRGGPCAWHCAGDRGPRLVARHAEPAHRCSRGPSAGAVARRRRAESSYIDKLLRAIVGIEMPIDRLEGKLKASQDEALQDRVGTVHGLREQRSDEAGSMADLVVKAIEADSAGRS